MNYIYALINTLLKSFETYEQVRDHLDLFVDDTHLSDVADLNRCLEYYKIVSIITYIISYTKFSTFNRSKNPHQFNFKAYMSKQNIRHQLFLSNKNSKIQKGPSTIYGYTHKIRNRINNNLKPHIKDTNNLNLKTQIIKI